MRIYSLLSMMLLACILSACEGTVKESGYTFLQKNIENETIVGKSRRDVRELLGTPSSVSSIDIEKWYYISTVTVDKSIFKRSLKQQDILEIIFNKQGRVISYNEYSKEDAKNISFDEGSTHTAGNKINIWEQLLGNIGRFSSGQVPVNP